MGNTNSIENKETSLAAGQIFEGVGESPVKVVASSETGSSETNIQTPSSVQISPEIIKEARDHANNPSILNSVVSNTFDTEDVKSGITWSAALEGKAQGEPAPVL